jgi:hypothetical protein
VRIAYRDHFCQQLDNSTSGIKATIAKLMQLLEAHDPELAGHLHKHKVGLMDTRMMPPLQLVATAVTLGILRRTAGTSKTVPGTG